MKKIILLFALLPLVCFSQEINQKKADSILVLLSKRNEDTTKVYLYQDLCDTYRDIDLKKTNYYNNKLLQLSKKLDFEKGINLYNFNLIYIVDYDNELVIMKKVEKTLIYFLKTKNYKRYVISQCFLARQYGAFRQLKKAEYIIQKTLPIAQKSSLNSETGYLLTLLGRIYYDKSLLSKSLTTYNNALLYLNKDKIKNKEYLSELHYNMGLVHEELGNYKQSLHYLNISELENKTESTGLYHAKAFAYNHLHDYNKALKILLHSKNLEQYQSDLQVNTFLLSETYYGLKKYNLAIENLLPILSKIKHNQIKMSSYGILAKTYLKLNNLQKAKEFNDKVGVLLPFSKRLQVKLDFLSRKTAIEEASGDYKAALQSQKLYTALKEEVNTKLNKEKIDELQIGFNVAEKDNNIKALKVAELEKNIQINNQTNYIIYGGIFLGILVLGILIFIVLYRTIKKKNSLISINNIALENAKVQLEKSVLVKETLLKEIHHRVKNNLQLVMSLLYIQSKEKGTNIDDFIEISQSRIIAMALIHENLYQTDDLSKVDFKEYANSLTQSIVASYNYLQQDIQLQIEVDGIYLDIQTAIPIGLIINELICNAYKHAFRHNKKGIITLQLVQKENNFELVLQDNGVGRSEEKKLKKTLGLELVHQLVSQINGILQVHDNGGMRYQIQFQDITL